MKSRSGIKRVFGLLAGLLLFLSPFLGPLPVLADVLEIPGTGACEVLLRALADAFQAEHPDHRVMVPPSIGSGGGIRLVGEDQALLARVARPLKDTEKAYGLRYLVFARDLVVFAVGAKASIKGLTTTQLAEVFSGKITNWRELGGGSAPIRVLLREPGDSSLLVIQEHLPAFRDLTFTPGGKVIYSDPRLLEILAKYKYAIGWLTFSSLKGSRLPLRPLAIDGIVPSPENARSHKYKLVGDYALVFKPERLNGLAKSFLDFIFSKNGQQVMKQHGVMPVEKE